MSWMKRTVTVLVASVVGVTSAVVSAGAAHAGLTGGPHADGTVVHTFAPGTFPESVALAGGGAYVSLGFAGEIERVAPDGTASTVATVDVGADSLLTGVAVAGDQLYFARAAFAGDGWLYSVPLTATNAEPTLVAELGPSFPNGLTWHDGLLYVSDSHGGKIFTVDPADDTVRTWCEDPALAGGKGLGINGITFRGDTLYAVVASTGAVVTLAPGSGPGTVTPVVRSNLLVTGDGIAFGPDGLLYVTINQSNKLVTLEVETGVIRTIAGRTEGLSYPTQIVLDGSSMWLTNGAIANGAATLMRFVKG